MSAGASENLSAVKIGETATWIVFEEGVPEAVVAELEAVHGAAAGALAGTRDLGGGAEIILNLALGGVIGNAAWAVLPKTARYVQSLRNRSRASVPDAAAAAERIRQAARSIHGSGVSVEILSLSQTRDCAWECDARVGGQAVAARIDPAGSVVAWVESRPEA